jgi:hypothetical protein
MCGASSSRTIGQRTGRRRQMKWLPIAVALAAGASSMARPTVRPVHDSLPGIQSDPTSGLLRGQASVTETRARERCLSLPVDAPNDRLQGPHGDSLVTTRCDVLRYRALGTGPKSGWLSVEYRWLSLFTAEDTTRGPAARDTVTEDEVVLLTAAEAGLVRPIWHERFETGGHGIWRSVTPEIAMLGTSILLSVEHCVNGTGGCSQEFLQRSPSGQWTSVRQVWLAQLPRTLAGRIQHGVHIDVRSLRGEGGLYGSHDPNCCPSELLRLQLGLRGDSLALRSETVVPTPQQ